MLVPGDSTSGSAAQLWRMNDALDTIPSWMSWSIGRSSTHIKLALHGNVTKRPFAHCAKSLPTHAFSPDVHGEFAFRVANFWLEWVSHDQWDPAGAMKAGDILQILRVDPVLESEPSAGNVERAGRDGCGESDGDNSRELHGEAVKERGGLRR